MSAPTWETTLSAMLTALAPLAILQGGAAGNGRYLRCLDRYLGQFDVEEAMQTGVAGRCPAVLVDFAGERPLETTVGRKTQRVEGTYLAICCVDSHRSRQDRDALFAVMRDVRYRLVGLRLPGLEMEPFVYAGIVVVAERPQVFAYAVRMTTIYRVDWTHPPAAPTQLLHVEGTVHTATNPPETIGGFEKDY